METLPWKETVLALCFECFEADVTLIKQSTTLHVSSRLCMSDEAGTRSDLRHGRHINSVSFFLF